MKNKKAIARFSITNDEAYEILRDTAIDIHSDNLSKYADAMDKALKTLKFDRWIPVTEGLPEPYTYVLTCDAYENINIFKRYEWEPAPFNITDKNPNFNPVVAWRPLPDPYHPQKLNNADEDTAQSGLQPAT